jgi:hypothetical protein
MPDRPLTVKQRKFKNLLPLCKSATEAAIKAGYSRKSARVSAHKNITEYNTKDYIQAKRQDLEAKSMVKAEHLLQDLISIKDKCQGVKELVDKDGKVLGYQQYDANAAIRAIDLALDIIGGKAPNKIEHTGQVSTTMQIVVNTRPSGLLSDSPQLLIDSKSA